jgi:hypothetical protein
VFIDNQPHGEGTITEDFTGFGCDNETTDRPMIKEVSINIKQEIEKTK